MLKRLCGIGLVILTGLILTTFALNLAKANHFHLATTPSVPMGIWRSIPLQGALRRGQVVLVCPPDTSFFRFARKREYIPLGDCPGGFHPFLKPIGALPGDTVVVSDAGLLVNGKLIQNSKQKSTDRKGRHMPKFPSGTYTVEPGMFWFISNYHPDSFDSRYFGPLNISQIQGRAKPVLVFN